MILKGESAEEFNRKADENYEKHKARQKQNLIDMMEADEKLGLYEKPQQEKGEFQRGVDSVKQELHEQRDWCECGNCEPIFKGGKMCKNSKWAIYYPYKPQPTEDVPKRWVDEVMLAEWMHDTYEEISKEKGWSTQEDCRVLFDDLPEKNKEVMLAVAGRLLDNGISEPTEDVEALEMLSNNTTLNDWLGDNTKRNGASGWEYRGTTYTLDEIRGVWMNYLVKKKS